MLVELVEKNLRSHFEVPRRNLSNAVVLASFPKSGNTWFRFVAANIVALSGGGGEVDFHNLDFYAPEIRRNCKLKGVIENASVPVFMKTHFYNVSGFDDYKAVVLYRHPQKVFLSYFDYMVREQGKSYSGFNAFLNACRVGLDAWKLFHLSWLGREAIFVSYEDIMKNQQKGLDFIYSSLGFELKDDLIEGAIIRSTKERMASTEREKGDPKKKNIGYDFVSMKNRDVLGLDLCDIQKIESVCCDVYSQLEERKAVFC